MPWFRYLGFMTFLSLGFIYLAFWFFWGAGLALWIFPCQWRRFFWVTVIPLGISLQIAVVWTILMVGSTVHVTALWTNLLPTIFLVTALGSAPRRRWLRLSFRLPQTRWAIALILLGLTIALLPPTVAQIQGAPLTTFSFGSCDAPDYAMGARLFLEKGRTATGGFWSQSDVHQLPGGFNFWTYWTRLNHFGPSALMAFSSACFTIPIWKLGTALAASLGACGAPIVFALSRAIFRFRGRAALAISVLYALSPLWLYGVYHVALAQLMGTLAVALILLFGLSTKAGFDWRAWCGGAGIGVFVVWLLLSCYAFMGAFAAVILAAMCVYRMGREGWVKPLKEIVGWGGLSVAGACVCFPSRAWGVWESAIFFGHGVFGWPVGPIQLPTMFGLVADRELHSMETIFVVLALLVLGFFWIDGVVAAHRAKSPTVGLSLAVTAVVFGSSILILHRDPRDAGLGSYKVYKLIAVLLPILLPSLLLGLRFTLNSRLRIGTVSILLLFLILFLPRPLIQMALAAWAMPLRVTPALADLQKFEKDPQIEGVNLISKHVWTRLWASFFLADKKLYFSNSTYVTRGITPLRGNWTLEDNESSIYGGEALHVGRLILRPREEPILVDVTFGIGWYGDEGDHRWSGATGRFFTIVLTAHEKMDVHFAMNGWYAHPGTRLKVFANNRPIGVEQEKGALSIDRLPLSVGKTELRFEADQAAEQSGSMRDNRLFLYSLRQLDLTQRQSQVAP